MGSISIESLLEQANSSPENDSSVNSAKRQLLTEAEAATFFEDVRRRMLDVREWGKNSSATDYSLFNAAGAEITGAEISVGHFIRISLYGGGKYDWVEVESITERPTEFVITVRPSHDPTEHPADVGDVSHFFGPEARNNFCLLLNEKSVVFSVIGIHEKQNTRFTDGLIESARNAAVANIGYYTGLQKTIWKEFAASFLETNED
jgi:hypothetical protein